ncbi:hypothetical protein [Lunatibacter salilacus]|uniref:hypothetical protein n=1 Tax=Lunatibacter salilacus TaxID=2483804 RepID=UPI00131C1AE4|nr:hypothetical protein [Lunatibacter salilacus]
MKIDTNFLYDLLPAYYRTLDDEQGLPLQAFIEILAREGGIVEDHISQQYENWFIETCEEWVVPYIGDLLGVKNIHEIAGASFSRRAYVANTLAYRRRKGTLPVLEQLALDVTGWRSKAVEFFQLLSATQNLNHLRLHCTATPDLRGMNRLDLINTAFDQQSHSVEVGRISVGMGKYKIQNIGIYLWRLQSYQLRMVDAKKVGPQAGIPDEAYTFSPLGIDTHLFNNPQTENNIVHLAEEVNVPGLLRRRILHDELETAREAISKGRSPIYQFFEPTYPTVFQLFTQSTGSPPSAIPTEEIAICNLSDWRVPPMSKTYQVYVPGTGYQDVVRPISAAVDPVLGRIVLSNPIGGAHLLGNFSYGFSGDIGGGPYDRKLSIDEVKDTDFDWHVGISKDKNSVQSEPIYETLQEAIDDWNSLDSTIRSGLITIMDNRSYQETVGLTSLLIAEGKQLCIIAADWPVVDLEGVPTRIPGTFNPEDLRPTIIRNLEIDGTAPATSLSGGSFFINGILLDGKLSVNNGNLKTCSIRHSTLVPTKGGAEIAPQTGILEFSIGQSICGAINVASIGALVNLEESIVDNNAGTALSVPEGHLGLQNCTVFGMVESESLDAGNCIFNESLDIARRQKGCVRFSYVPLGSQTPRRFRCQPELEIQEQIKERKELGPTTLSEELAIQNRVLNWLLPTYNSKEYGHHAYSQLANATPEGITTGADNAAEMGVFNYLQQPQRLANLEIVLEEYLRLGLEAGVIFVT